MQHEDNNNYNTVIICILLFNALTEKQAKYRFDWYYWEHSDSLRQHEQ